MGPTTLDDLVAESSVEFTETGLAVQIPQKWVVNGERRLSYTTLIRLVECCRELHWRRDILSLTKPFSVDSITKSIKGEFFKPIPVGSTVVIQYGIREVRTRGYSILFDVYEHECNEKCAQVEIVSIFYNPDSQTPSKPPPTVHRRLVNLARLLAGE